MLHQKLLQFWPEYAEISEQYGHIMGYLRCSTYLSSRGKQVAQYKDYNLFLAALFCCF